MENSILDAVFNGNFKAFKESVSSALYGKIASRIEDAKGEVAKEIFGEEKESDDVEYKERINHSDKNGHPENDEDDEDDDEDDEGKGGEFLVHVKLLDVPDTELENFRVVGTSKADVESKLEKFYGKGKYEVKSIKLSEEVVDEAKVDRDSYKVYHGSYSSAIDEAGEHAKRRGYTHDPEEIASKVGFGPEKPKDGVSNRFSVHLYKDGEKQKRMHHFQVYGMGNGRYELNQYMDPKGRGKQTSNESAEEIEEGRFEKGEDVGKPGLNFQKIDEISQDTLRRYKRYAEHDADWHSQQHDDPYEKNWLGPQFPNGTKAKVVKYHKDKAERREKGIADADARLNDISNNQYKSGRKYHIGDEKRRDEKETRKKPKRDWESEMGHGVYGQTEEIEEGRFEKGEDIGKPGLNFKKIAKKAGAEYGSEEAGKRVAGSILKKILKKKVANESALESKGPSTLHNINHKGMTAPEMLKAELPLHRHIEKELANHGHEKGTKEYKEKYDNALAYYNRTGAPKVSEDKEKNESVKIGNKPEEMALGGYLKSIGLKAKKANTGPKDVDDAVKETGKVKQMESVNSLQSIAKIAQNIEECSTYKGDYDYKNGDKDKEYATSHESFSDAIEAAKEHAKASGYSHDPEEFNHIVNTGFIKPKDKKTHAFHVSLYDKKDGHEVLNKIHNFQITGSGDGKFSMVSDIK